MSASNSILAPQTSAPNRAAQIGVLFAIVTGLTVPMYGFVAWQLQAWQLWAVAATNFVLMVGGGVAWRIARRGNPVTALRLLIGVLILGAMLSVSFVSGIGVLGGILVVMLGLSIASQGIPRNLLNRTLVVIVVAAFVVIGVSFITTPIQFAAPFLDNFIAIASIAIVTVFGFFIARQFNSYPLPTKLLVMFLGLVAFTSTVQGFVSNLIVRNDIEQRVGTDLKLLSQSKAQEVATIFERQLDALRVISLNKLVQDSLDAANQTTNGDVERLLRLDEAWRSANEADPLIQSVTQGDVAIELREFQRVFPENAEVFVTDKYGGNVAATNRTSDYYQGDEAWWQGALQNGLYIGQPEYDESANLLSVIVALPVPGHDRNEIVGVVRSTLDLTVFAQALSEGTIGATTESEIHLPKGAHINVLENGQLVFHPDADSSEDDLERLFQSAQNIMAFEHEGERVLGSQTPIADVTFVSEALSSALRDLDWRLLVTQTEAEAFASLETTTNAALLVVLAALLVAGIIATVLAQFVSRPITRLTETAARITDGDLTAQAPVEADDEVGALATAFNVMTTQLRETLAGLEARVTERTRAIAASAEVSRRLSTVLDRQKLVRDVVEQVQDAFGYYYVQIYFWDETREHLVMAGGTGEPGQMLLARGHKLLAGHGLVGRAAETNTTVLVPHTAENPTWLPNPLLPDTRAEVAVPIALGDRVLGVLDIQHNVANGLDNEDVEVLQSLANQVAVATQNARTFAQTQRQADVEALVNTIGQKIQSATTMESALQVAAREVGRALGGTKTVVRLKTSPLVDHASR